MSQVSAVRIRNLRSLNDTDFVDIKPITILVGKNSAGKSTFARTFPLLRQSVEENKRAPILWFGRLVDFGAFPDALSTSGDADEIEFSFRIQIQKSSDQLESHMANLWLPEVLLLEDVDVDLTLKVKKSSSGDGTYASNITLKIYENLCSIEFSDSDTVTKISVNDFTWTTQPDRRLLVIQRRLIPRVQFLRQRKIRSSEEVVWVEDEHPLWTELRNAVMPYVHGNTSQETIDRMAQSFSLGSDEAMIRAMASIPDGPASWRNQVKHTTPNSTWFKRLKNLIFASRLPSLLSTLDDDLANYFSGVRYLEPLRASAERYYRKQELAVDEIDSKGANVAMYLDSLTTREKEAFELWTQEHFGVTVSTTNEGGHLALKLRETGSDTATNLADMGFGFSQVLPIAVQLWSSMRLTRNRFRRRAATTCLVIEQPELHLHPEYQARLADIMVAALFNHGPDRKSRISIIAETHSPNIINRLGQLIEARKLSAENVQVVLFDKQKADSDTQVRISNFSEDGVLQNWPFGFFEPEDR